MVKFADEDSEIKITIKNYDDFILHYYYYLGDMKIKWCEECGEKLIRVNGKRDKYCKQCNYIKQRKWDNEYKNRVRK